MLQFLTIGLSSWAVDLKDVGAIYPFQGSEYIMVFLGVAFWIIWHIWQIGSENAELRSKTGQTNIDNARSAIDRY